MGLKKWDKFSKDNDLHLTAKCLIEYFSHPHRTGIHINNDFLKEIIQ